MSKLYDLMAALATDIKLQRDFALDSMGVAKKFGLTPPEQAALFSGNLDEIYSMAGSNGLVICKQITAIDPCKPPPEQTKK